MKLYTFLLLLACCLIFACGKDSGGTPFGQGDDDADNNNNDNDNNDDDSSSSDSDSDSDSDDDNDNDGDDDDDSNAGDLVKGLDITGIILYQYVRDTYQLPVVVHSVIRDRQLEEFFRLHDVEYLRAPVSPNEIVEALERAMGRRNE